jgi:hypothetical protein
MKLNDLVKTFEIFTSNEEKKMLEKLSYPRLMSSFSENEQFIIEGMIRKSLVIKIGDKDPKIIANEF